MTKEQLERDSGVTRSQLSLAREYFKASADMLCPPIFRAAYSDRMAWILASMAQLAYDRFEDNPDVRTLFIAKLKSGGFELIRTFYSQGTDTQGFLARNSEFAVLAFRGTEVTKRQDVITDIKASKISVLQGRVHGGFVNAYKSVAPDIRRSLLELKGVPLYITGHSLGAALATIATHNLEHTDDYPQFRQIIAACYTFGSPRVGNSRYDFRAPIYRVVNTTDVVTAIPFLAMGYMHLGDVRFLGAKEGEFQRGIPVLRRLYLFLLTALKFFGPLVKDHGIDQYRRKLQVIAQERNDPETIRRKHLNLVR
ncbi:MAG: lipase family protein [Chloroflexota bacterium]